MIIPLLYALPKTKVGKRFAGHPKTNSRTN
jgi:hypothetical protein